MVSSILCNTNSFISLVEMVGIYGVSNFVGELMPNPVHDYLYIE